MKYLGIEAKRAKPTKSHRPAIWECMLGTVYAMNSEGKVKYHDYNHQAAKEWAGIEQAEDIRVWPYPDTNSWARPEMPRRKQKVLWVKE
jgi:hypothetical protein